MFMNFRHLTLKNGLAQGWANDKIPIARLDFAQQRQGEFNAAVDWRL